MKRGKHGSCYCNTSLRDAIQGTCRFGNCVEFCCPQCGRWRADWGPVACKCDGYIRWIWHKDMGPKDHVPVKPSLAGRTRRAVKRR